jgi:hypothetical protein
MSTNVTCPECQTRLSVSENVTARTLVCPHCLTDIENPRAGPASVAPNFLRDVRRDSNMTSWILLVLIGLCVAGIAMIYAHGQGAFGNRPDSLWILPAMYGFGILDVLVFLAAVRPLWRVLLGGLENASTVGITVRIIGAIVLTVGLILAIVIFFFAVCLGLAISSK